MKKLVTLLLLAGIAASMLASCSESNSEVQDTQADETTSEGNSAEETTVAETEPPKDFEGSTFTVFHSADDGLTPYWYYGADEQNGDILNDAIYERNAKIAELYNVDLKFFGYETSSSNGADMAEKLEGSILSGDNAYQLTATHMHQASVQMLTAGYLANLLDLELDLTQPHYNQSINENLEINGYLPALVSDFNITSQIFTFAMIFNKDMVESYELDSPYDMVRDGSWTLDRFSEYIRPVAADVDGNGTFDENDSYGYAGNTGIAMQAFFYGSGLKFIELDEEDKPQIQLESEKFATFYEKIVSLYKDDNKTYLIPRVDDVCPIPFDSGRILFIAVRLRLLDQYRDVSDFGIVPFPKYDEAQEKYYSYTDARGAMTMMPITNTDFEGTAILLDALSKLSRETVVPVYRETVLESKYARDEDSLEMLNIIFDNRVFDFGYVFRTDPLTFATYNMYKANANPASYIASNKDAAMAHFDKIIEAYESYSD